MPLKTLKRDTAEKLTLEWILHIRNYKLTLDKNSCVGCQICTLACPKEAIELLKQPKTSGMKVEHATIDIDLEKCNFCGICDILCPYGAVELTVNGENLLSVVEKESFPKLIRDIQIDASKCPLNCVDYEEVCPLDIIKITRLNSGDETVEEVDSLAEEEKKELQARIDIEEKRCPCCRICEFKFPEGVIRVQKFFHGKIDIHLEKCPENCKDCLDVCPITGVLYLSEEDRKVHVDEVFCVYCGACKIVCPVEDALELERTLVRHTPISSGAWNKALERIASPIVITKELKAKGSQKARESVKKRLGWRVS